MRRYDVSVVLDGVFTGFSVFFVTFIVLSTFASAAVTWICALLVGLLAALGATLLFARRKGKKALAAEDVPKKNNLMFSLALNGSDEDIVKLFAAFGKTVVKTPRGLFVEEADSYVFQRFSFDGVSKDFLADVYKKANGKTAFVFAAEFSEELRAFARSLGGNLKLFGGEDVYALFKRAEMLPPMPEVKTKRRGAVLKEIAKTAFVRRRAPRYFLFGATFLLFSFLVPFKLYYIVFGSLMMLLAVACLFFSPAPPEKNFWEKD